MDNFIITKDGNTREKLLAQGYKEINNKNNVYIFMNDFQFKFMNDIDTNKIQYTNILTF